MGSGVPKGADGEHQHTGMGCCVRKRGADSFDGGSGRVEALYEAGAGRAAENRADEDGDGGWEHEGGEKGAVIAVLMSVPRNYDMFLILLTQDLSWLSL